MKNDLLEEICYCFGEDYKGDLAEETVRVDDKEYLAFEVKRLTTKDEGKYQLGGVIYEVYECGANYKSLGERLFYMERDFTQTGSYYSDQEREWESPYIVEPKEVTIIEWRAV